MVLLPVGRFLGGMTGAVVAALLVGVRPAVAADGTAGPTSLGQQPLPTAPLVPPTVSQGHTHQLNQLFQFEATPDICAAGEGYVSAQYMYLPYDTVDQNRLQVQGQYAFTNQLAVGATIPYVDNSGYNVYSEDYFIHTANSGLGDVSLYVQYKLDKLVDPAVINLTAQADLVLPTGDRNAFRDTGYVGVRPLLLAYKDLGQRGPGILGVYGLLGATVTEDPDVRLGVAATYDFGGVVAALELTGVNSSRNERSLALLTPGVLYHGLGGFEFALGIPLGLNDQAPDVGVTFKVTYAFQN